MTADQLTAPRAMLMLRNVPYLASSCSVLLTGGERPLPANGSPEQLFG
jgi:hypothetical protein